MACLLLGSGHQIDETQTEFTQGKHTSSAVNRRAWQDDTSSALIITLQYNELRHSRVAERWWADHQPVDMEATTACATKATSAKPPFPRGSAAAASPAIPSSSPRRRTAPPAAPPASRGTGPRRPPQRRHRARVQLQARPRGAEHGRAEGRRHVVAAQPPAHLTQRRGRGRRRRRGEEEQEEEEDRRAGGRPGRHCPCARLRFGVVLTVTAS
jgi:hypothetical protein